MLGLPESLGNRAAFRQRRLYNDVLTCETLTLEATVVSALDEVSEKDGGDDAEEEVAFPAHRLRP